MIVVSVFGANVIGKYNISDIAQTTRLQFQLLELGVVSTWYFGIQKENLLLKDENLPW